MPRRFTTSIAAGVDLHENCTDSLASNDHEASFILTLFGVPMRTCGGKWKIEQRLAINDSSRVNIDALVAELKEESRELAN